MTLELTQIVETVDQLLPQLKNFIVQFNQLVTSSGINVITDMGGNMSLDVPSSMPDDQAEHLGKRIGVIDRLITTRGQEVDALLHKGISIEKKLDSPEFKSKILERIAEFQKLNKSYKH